MKLVILKAPLFILALMGASYFMDNNFLEYLLKDRPFYFVLSDIVFVICYLCAVIFMLKKSLAKRPKSFVILSVLSTPLYYIPSTWFFYYNGTPLSILDQFGSFLIFFFASTIGYSLGCLGLSIAVLALFKIIDKIYYKTKN